MNEISKSPLTLPEDIKHEDLDDGKAGVEELHNLAQAQKDNANAYRKQMAEVTTPSLLEKLKSSLKPDAEHDNKVEFDVRTGEDPDLKLSLERMIELKKEVFRNQDNNFNSLFTKTFLAENFSDLDLRLMLAKEALETGLIREKQYDQLTLLEKDCRKKLEEVDCTPNLIQ